jgi:hypothetical protein
LVVGLLQQGSEASDWSTSFIVILQLDRVEMIRHSKALETPILEEILNYPECGAKTDIVASSLIALLASSTVTQTSAWMELPPVFETVNP